MDSTTVVPRMWIAQIALLGSTMASTGTRVIKLVVQAALRASSWTTRAQHLRLVSSVLLAGLNPRRESISAASAAKELNTPLGIAGAKTLTAKTAPVAISRKVKNRTRAEAARQVGIRTLKVNKMTASSAHQGTIAVVVGTPGHPHADMVRSPTQSGMPRLAGTVLEAIISTLRREAHRTVVNVGRPMGCTQVAGIRTAMHRHTPTPGRANALIAAPTKKPTATETTVRAAPLIRFRPLAIAALLAHPVRRLMELQDLVLIARAARLRVIRPLTTPSLLSLTTGGATPPPPRAPTPGVTGELKRLSLSRQTRTPF